jgi:hypothetical protein
MKRNQKLTDRQINTVIYLYSKGVPTILIARTLQMLQGVALSTTYYHVDKIEAEKRMLRRAQIVALIHKGYNTKQIADQWNMPLADVNKIYAK